MSALDVAAAGLEPDRETMQELARLATERIVRYLDTLPAQRASDTAGGSEVAQSLVEPMPEHGAPFEPLLDTVFEQLLPKGYNTASPGALSFVTGGGIFHSAVADFIATATNPYVAYWAASPGFVQMENTVVRWFADVMGLPEGAGGVLTSGGSIANLTAVITARALRLPENFLLGTIYASDQAHHSVQKAIALAGFPASCLRIIPSDETCRIRLDLVEQAIRKDRLQGRTPFLLVGMAGTTGTGAVDDLHGLAGLAEQEHLWLHVDAAYGGFFNLTTRGKCELAGIERADSIVLDPHKSLFLPFGTGCILARREGDLRRAHLVHSHCIRESVELGERVSATNPADLSLELTRDCRGLRVWLPLKLLGAATFRRCLDEKLDLAQWTASQLATIDGVELLAKPRLSTVAFRVRRDGYDAAELDVLNQAILERINQLGRVHLSGATVRGGFAIRICVLAFRAHQRVIAECLEDLQRAMREVA
ncbi:aminotransferase class I/II-fold pyridoxal phosphate-dependent enzyme [soil metagenome]